MYLKALEMQGFKSFADKTRLTFQKDITAIVGPNGSGKSNISDALLWVMGEQRTKALRGGKMEDVIFGGTEKRKPMGFSQVSLILDNTQQVFPAYGSEVMITRRYYRSGESEYFINREAVRLKDVHELLMDTGLGRDGYSIIGQGRISDIVSAKSIERREIFEEAAGISRYRYRKEEAQRKLQHTDADLLRVNDKISELEQLVTPLREQAETAKRYLLLRDQLRVLEVSLWLSQLEQMQVQSQTVHADWEEANAALHKAQQELALLYEETERYSCMMQEAEQKAEHQRQKLRDIQNQIRDCEHMLAVLSTNLENNQENMQQIQQMQTQQSDRAAQLCQQIAKYHSRLQTIVQEKDQMHDKMQDSQQILEQKDMLSQTLQDTLLDLLKQEAALLDQIRRSEAAVSMEMDAKDTFYSKEKQLLLDIESAQEKRQQLEQQRKDIEIEMRNAQEQVQALSRFISEYEKKREDIKHMQRGLEQEQVNLTIEAKAMDARIYMLTEMEKEYEGFSKSVKSVMREASKGNLQGIHGPIGDLIHTETQFALALETALGASVSHIVTETQHHGKEAIELLKAKHMGRCTFLPLDILRGSYLRQEPAGEPGYLGTALALSSYDEKYKAIVSNLLGRTCIVETLSDALLISKKYNHSLRIVTLDGQLLSPGGSMTGGSTSKTAGILSRKNERKFLLKQRDLLEQKRLAHDAKVAQQQGLRKSVLETLDDQRKQLQQEIEHLNQKKTELARCDMMLETAIRAEEMARQAYDASQKEQGAQTERLSSLQEMLITQREQHGKLQQEISSYRVQQESLLQAIQNEKEEISHMRGALSALEAEEEAMQQGLTQLQGVKEDLSGEAQARKETTESLEEKRKEMMRDMAEHGQKKAALEEAQSGQERRMEESVKIRLQLEEKRRIIEKHIQEKNRCMIDLERICGKLEQKKLSHSLLEKQIIDRLWDTYRLSHSAAQSIKITLTDFQEETRKAAIIKKEMHQLGTPNIGAIEEYDRIRERYEFLVEQRDDVQKAKKELVQIISDVTKEMKEIFAQAFAEMDRSFQETFLALFGGGKAALQLEDPEDVLNCGIEIKVQPPGKQLRAISLLSGGEKAFVAIALYFAIMKVRPTPFCVMDEIEAALDEANVIRYAQYMREMAKSTQFIVITHRRGTMEEADMLYGVTMQEKGISTILSIDLEEAEKTIAS